MEKRENEQLQELTLLLMYLTSWKEDPKSLLRPKPARPNSENYILRCRKGYDHKVMDNLAEAGFIGDYRQRSPVVISPEGEHRAKELIRKYGIQSIHA